MLNFQNSEHTSSNTTFLELTSILEGKILKFVDCKSQFLAMNFKVKSSKYWEKLG